MAHLKRIVVCKECDGDNPNADPDIIEDIHTGDLICNKCGLVAECVIDQRTEWRTFANEDGDDPSRVGGPIDPFMEGMPLTTSISRRDGGSGLSKELNRAQMRATTMSSADKALLDNFKAIENFCQRISLPQNIVDAAKRVFKRNEKTLRGKATESIIAASIYLACRVENVPRTMKEICALTTVSKKEIGKCIRKMTISQDEQTGVIESKDFISRFCSHLHLSMLVERAAFGLCEKVKELGIAASKSPISVVAAAIYLITQLSDTPKNAKEVATVVGVAEVTIKSAYKDLYERRKEIVLKEFDLPRGVESLPEP